MNGNKPTLALAFMAITAVAVVVAGCSDDPFYPRPPGYTFRAQVSGLDGFATDNGTAIIMLPLPAWNGTPIRQGGWVPFTGIWTPEKWEDNSVRYLGTASLTVVNTSFGPMLKAKINMTDYYLSTAKATPIAISPGQNTSGLPVIVPERIDKNLSFDYVNVVDSGYAGPWEYPGAGKLQDRQDVIRFIDAPLLPAEDRSGTGNFTTYIYIDDRLRPLNNSSSINVLIRLRVMLNHNFVNASVEGTRRFEYHDYTINQSIPIGATGFMPLRVEYAYHSGPHYESLI